MGVNMNFEIFFALAQSMGRLDLAGPLVLGFVATDLFALALGLKRSSSLFKKLEQNPSAFPSLHLLPGTRRKYFKLAEIEVWNKSVLRPLSAEKSSIAGPIGGRSSKRVGRPTKLEQREARNRGISIAELRDLAVEGGGK